MKIPSLKKMIKGSSATVPAPAPVAPAKKVAVKKVAVKKVAVKKVAVKPVAKKTAVKTTAPKKTPAKKAAAKKTDPKRLVVASDSESFWVTNGHVLNNLVALEMALKIMSKPVYDYHISKTGSDFADWVEAVLFAPACASELRKAKTAKAAERVVTHYLKDHQL